MPAASRKTAPDPISINRAPVLSLWGAVVAERLGFDPDEAASLGEAVSILNARSKGRRLGIFGPPKDRSSGMGKDLAGAAGPEEPLELLGRPVPIVRTERGVRAAIGGEVINSQQARRKLEQKFGEAYPQVRAAMERVARSFTPAELAAAAYPMYERFRPGVPPGTRGWGARGQLDLALIASLAKRRPASAAHRHRGQHEPLRRARDNHPDRTASTSRRRRPRTTA